MVSLLVFSSDDIAIFFEDVMKLRRRLLQNFYVRWSQFRNIMITNTFVSNRKVDRRYEENGHRKYERMAYHEYLIKRGVSMENVVVKPAIALPSPKFSTDASMQSEILTEVHQCNRDFSLMKFQGRNCKSHWTDDLYPSAECDASVETHNQSSDRSSLLIASRTSL